MRDETALRRPRPWYREPWPWLLMLGPAIVVVAGAVTVWLAVASSDGLVADDYYKQGLAINQTLARSERAKALALSARLRIDAERIGVSLAGHDPDRLSERLRITFSHPTRGGLDHAVTLERGASGYEGKAPLLAAGRWRVLVEDAGGNWRLAGVMRIPDETEIELSSAE